MILHSTHSTKMDDSFNTYIHYVSPKKRSKTCDIPAQLRKEVSAKVVFNTKTKSFSNWQRKNYASDVLEYICKIIQG